MDKITVDAIYRDGVITPLDSVDLPDNTFVKVQITRQNERLKGELAKYKGILAGKGDFSLEEIDQAVRSATEAHLQKLIGSLTENLE
jgi:predicted DNA-binding antitoxin AbrB/MazE fold protein